MIKVDLITGFLGSGKTSFIKQYASYLLNEGYKIGIIENDYGAVNVDLMILQDLQSPNCDIEMISGGCDKQTHYRRFKTKLIAMKMIGYDRILVEPSGIYDMDEFFDVINDDPLSNWYEIGSIITLVDSNINSSLPQEAQSILASQVAYAGKIITTNNENNILDYLNKSLDLIKCQRKLNIEDLITKPLKDYKDNDFYEILNAGYQLASYPYLNLDTKTIYQTIYLFNNNISIEKYSSVIDTIFKDSNCGYIFIIL
jgi:G3E family GTPase